MTRVILSMLDLLLPQTRECDLLPHSKNAAMRALLAKSEPQPEEQHAGHGIAEAA